MDLGRYINPDEIAETLEGEYASRVRRAQAIADAERAECIANRQSFSFETVMSHPSKIDVLKAARANGFRTALYFVATESVELNVLRVRQRVQLGGHPVPEDRIRQRYVRTLALLPAAMACVDQVVLFDNSDGRPAILRPFFRRLGDEVKLSPPVPMWAIEALSGVNQSRE